MNKFIKNCEALDDPEFFRLVWSQRNIQIAQAACYDTIASKCYFNWVRDIRTGFEKYGVTLSSEYKKGKYFGEYEYNPL